MIDFFKLSDDAMAAFKQSEAIHVWNFKLSEWANSLRDLELGLTSAEQKEFQSFYPKYRFQKIAARALLRRLLSQYLSVDPLEINFEFKNGKPWVDFAFLNSASGASLQFNLSHSLDCLLIALHPRLILGIDVEYIDTHRPIQNIAPRFLNAAETERLEAQIPHRRTLKCWELWVFKEALGKALGWGLKIPLTKIDFAWDFFSSQFSVSIQGQEWFLQRVEMPSDYVAALAFPQIERIPKIFNFPSSPASL